MSVKNLRKEYKLVLHCLTTTVQLFLLIFPVLGFFLSKDIKSTVGMAVMSGGAFLGVFYLYHRASVMFNINPEEMFAASKSEIGATPRSDRGANGASVHEQRQRENLFRTSAHYRSKKTSFGEYKQATQLTKV